LQYPLIAIIDDDAGVRESLEQLMRSAHYRVRTFCSVGDFLAMDHPEQTSCIVTDVHMPELSGWDLMEILSKEGRITPVILISALPDRDLEVRAKKCGARFVLKKPFEASALFESIAASLPV
jgi:FixJ family two-component response regulator